MSPTATEKPPIAAPWSEPKEIQGKWILRTFELQPYNDPFWSWWKGSKVVQSYKDGGLKCSKNARTGTWEIQWWRNIGDDMPPPGALSFDTPYTGPPSRRPEAARPANAGGAFERGSTLNATFADKVVEDPQARLARMLAAFKPEPLGEQFAAFLEGKKSPFGGPLALKSYQERHTAILATALANHGAALDASETGTGKTPCALAAFTEAGFRKFGNSGKRYKLLIICPLSVIPSWRRWMRAFHLDGEVWNYEKVRMGKTRFGHFQVDPDNKSRKKFVWTMPEELDSCPWAVVFDESHKLKSPDSQQGMMGRHIVGKGIPVLLLSATNAKDPADMRNTGAMLRLHNGRRTEWVGWCQRYGCGQTRYGLKFWGSKNDLARLHGEIFPLRGSRIRIAELGDAFPKNTVLAEAWQIEAAASVQQAYDTAELECEKIALDSSLSAIEKSGSILAEMMKARVAAEKAKYPEMVERAKEAIAEGNSVVLFLNFRQHVIDSAQALGDPRQVVIGAQSPQARQDAVERFGRDEAHFIVVSLQAGGAGLDGLQDLRGERPRISFISPSYSAIDLVQAIGRIFRANSASPSRQYIVFAAETIEEQACESVQEKLLQIATLNDGALSSGLRFMAEKE